MFQACSGTFLGAQSHTFKVATVGVPEMSPLLLFQLHLHIDECDSVSFGHRTCYRSDCILLESMCQVVLHARELVVSSFCRTAYAVAAYCSACHALQHKVHVLAAMVVPHASEQRLHASRRGVSWGGRLGQVLFS